MDEGVKIPIGLDGSTIPGQLAGIGDLLKQSLGKAGADAGRASAAGISEIGGAASGALAKVTELAAGFGLVFGAVELVHKAVDFMVEGIKNADMLRDLHASIGALSSSAAAGEAAFARMEKVAEQTRVTGNELVAIYGHALPLALDKGFSEEGAQRFVAQIAKLAPAIGLSVEQAMQQAEQILAGRVRKTNLLAHAIGLDPEQYTKGLQGLESVFPKIDELAAKGEKMGQTFESAGKKIKDAMLDAFSEGFNSARGEADTALEGVMQAFRTPELLGAIHELGVRVAELAPVFIETFSKAAEAVAMVTKAFKDLLSLDFSSLGADWAALIDKIVAKIFRALQSVTSLGGKHDNPLSDYFSRVAYSLEQGADNLLGKIAKVGPTLQANMQKMFMVGEEEYGHEATSTDLKGITGLKPSPAQLAAMQKAREEIDKAHKAASEAQLAFDNLFAEPQSDPLLKALQDAQGQAHALDEKFKEAEQSLKTMLLKEDLSQDARTAIKGAIEVYDELRKAIGGTEAAKEQAISDNFFQKQADQTEKAVTDAKESFDQFSQGALRGFGDVKTGFEQIGEGGFGADALKTGFAALKTQLDAALADAKNWEADEFGELRLTPEHAAEIAKHYQNLGRDMKEALSNALDQMHTVAHEGIQKVFDELDRQPGIKSFGAGLFGQLDQAALVAATAAAKQIQELMKAFGVEIDFDTAMKSATRAVQPDLNKAYTEAGKKAADQATEALKAFSSEFAGLFVAALQGGAKGFADAASQQFFVSAEKGAMKLGDVIGSIAFGTAPDPTFYGGADSNAYKAVKAESDTKNAQIAAVMQGTMQAIGETMKIFQQAKQGQAPSILGTTVSFALTGASIGSAFPGLGTIIGAAIGAVVGAVIGILATAKAKAEQVFFTYGIRDGKAYVEPTPGMQKQFGNLPTSQYQDLMNQIKKTWESTTNDYIKLFGKFGTDVADGIMEEINHINFAGMIDTSKSGIKNLMQDFQHWVTTDLPANIAGNFREPLSKEFQKVGLDVQRFNQIFDTLLGADPATTAKGLMDVYDALSVINRVTAEWSGQNFGITVGILSKTREDMARSFADQLAQADVGLVQMGDTMSNLFGAEQISAFKEWSDALLQREAAVKQFFQQIAQDIDNVIAGYQSKIRDLTLAGMKKEDGSPDVAAQVGYLKKYADTLWGQITRATTPEEVMRLSDELSKTISQIQQVGGAQSVEAAEAYRKWAIEQLTSSQDLVVDKLNQLAHDVAVQNAAFVDAIQGFIDALLKATDQIVDHTTTEETQPPAGGGAGTGGNRNIDPYDTGPGTQPWSPRGGDNPDFFGDGFKGEFYGYGSYGGGGSGYGPIAAGALPPVVDDGRQVLVNGGGRYEGGGGYGAPLSDRVYTEQTMDSGGSVPSQQYMQKWIEGLDASGGSFDESARKFVEAMKLQAENAAANAAAAQLFAQAVANFEATVAAGLAGGLDITFNGEDAGTVSIDAGGFDSRTQSSKGRR